jgi:hypothetical protein
MARDIERQNFLPECEAENKVKLAQFKQELEDLLMTRHGITVGDCTDDVQIEAEFRTGSTAVDFVEWIADKHELDRIDRKPFN